VDDGKSGRSNPRACRMMGHNLSIGESGYDYAMNNDGTISYVNDTQKRRIITILCILEGDCDTRVPSITHNYFQCAQIPTVYLPEWPYLLVLIYLILHLNSLQRLLRSIHNDAVELIF
jgi:hypothetical protein